MICWAVGIIPDGPILCKKDLHNGGIYDTIMHNVRGEGLVVTDREAKKENFLANRYEMI